MTINNCTLSSNTVSGASATGSQIYLGHQLTNASATLSNTTVLSDNVAPAYSGGAIFCDNGGALTVGNAIIQAGVQEQTILNAGSSTVTSAGYNLSSDNGSGFLTGPAIRSTPIRFSISGSARAITVARPTRSPSRQTVPAMDKGKRNAVAALGAATDQRGSRARLTILILPTPPGRRKRYRRV